MSSEPAFRKRAKVFSLLLCAPGDVVGTCGGAVFVHELLNHLARVIQLVKVVLENVLLPELLEEGLPLPQLIILTTGTLKQLGVRERTTEIIESAHLAFLHVRHQVFPHIFDR